MSNNKIAKVAVYSLVCIAMIIVWMPFYVSNKIWNPFDSALIVSIVCAAIAFYVSFIDKEQHKVIGNNPICKAGDYIIITAVATNKSAVLKVGKVFRVIEMHEYKDMISFKVYNDKDPGNVLYSNSSLCSWGLYIKS